MIILPFFFISIDLYINVIVFSFLNLILLSFDTSLQVDDSFTLVILIDINILFLDNSLNILVF